LEIGSANPFMRLADVDVASGASSIVNADITDLRVVYELLRATDYLGFQVFN
jgi:hypothetical protein